MQPYNERAAQVARESQIAVMVLLNPDCTDLEFWRVQPRQAALTTPEEFAARKLRPVGVVGIHGTTTHVAFREPLDATTVDAIAAAFAEYIRVLVGDSIAAQFEARQKSDEVDWLERLYHLPDDRLN